MNEQVILCKLKDQLSYMFSDKGYFTYYKGWLPTFVKLCHEIDVVLGDDKRGFKWVQIKEKYGAARFYYEMDGTRDLILDLNVGGRLVSMLKHSADVDKVRVLVCEKISNAQKETATKCIVCGAPAKIELKVRWLVCLCELHRDYTRDEISTNSLE